MVTEEGALWRRRLPEIIVREILHIYQDRPHRLIPEAAKSLSGSRWCILGNTPVVHALRRIVESFDVAICPIMDAPFDVIVLLGDAPIMASSEIMSLSWSSTVVIAEDGALAGVEEVSRALENRELDALVVIDTPNGQDQPVTRSVLRGSALY